MKGRALVRGILLGLSLAIGQGVWAAEEPHEAVAGGIDEYKHTSDLSAQQIPDDGSTADHARFKELQGPFADGPSVTAACLSCHNKAGDQFLHSIHWKWEYKHPKTGQVLGKKTLVNNFCTNARGNEGMCSQCHAAYNHTSYEFDYKNTANIDCVVCHDRTGTYYRTPATKGSPACSVMFEGKDPIDWTKVAQSVGMPTRRNCGTCHFYGGGGDNVKHGDLSSALAKPAKDLDIHMASDGLNFACQKCHVTRQHITAGSRYEMAAVDLVGTGKPGERRQASSCESCHGNQPHPVDGILAVKLNGHTDKVACVTCHVPEYAKGGVATKTEWDWRTAGKLKDGEGFYVKGYTQGNGVHRKTYKSIKGDFKYGENLKPEYAWFDGTMRYTTIDTKFDPAAGPVKINSFAGSYEDPQSRIWPFKRMKTVQPYDKGNNTLVYMHLWGDDDSSFWGNYDMAKAISYGMNEAGKPYSGEFDYIETASYWPITHMVAPKEKALRCGACHSENGRLAALGGFYMPGRDRWWWLDLLGWLAIGGALAIAIIHSIARVILCKKNRLEQCKTGEEK
ncbi:MAG: cytochrome C [Hyphomicrobiales bacterium]|nr:MAG: cytochrome C [Hyphomicrobiales bacterium]